MEAGLNAKNMLLGEVNTSKSFPNISQTTISANNDNNYNNTMLITAIKKLLSDNCDEF